MLANVNVKSKNLPNNRRPSLPVPGTSKNPEDVRNNGNVRKEQTQEPWRKRCCRYMYDRERKLFCGRTSKSWLFIIVYSIMYLIFLSTYTLAFLVGSLSVIKILDDYPTVDKTELLTYSTQGIGLSATPTSVNTMPVIWYRNDPPEYQKYVNGLESLLNKRRKRETNNFTDLGPCGVSPFGYGSEPCVIIRINKQLKWSAKPLNASCVRRMDVPDEVQKWLKLKDQKLWLHCDGYHSYDKEHIGKIKYYPDPPGFDPMTFPLNANSNSPLIALQISEFTLGISLTIQCKLWYEDAVSTIEFMIYVTPKNISV